MSAENLKSIENAIVEALKIAETRLPADVLAALKKAYEEEDSALAKTQLRAILKNVELSEKHSLPMCQDTGLHTFFVEVGVSSDINPITMIQIIKNAVVRATKEIPLRPNTVNPFTGENPGDNTGRYVPYISFDFVEDSKTRIMIMPKGGGSENAAALGMLSPGLGLKGVRNFVLEHLAKVADKACPPITVGIGIGGGADLCMKLAKKSLLRPIGVRHSDNAIAKFEEEMLDAINNLGIGAMGVGGKITALDVHVEWAHRHPASLPVGVVVQCWAARRATVIIDESMNVKIEGL